MFSWTLTSTVYERMKIAIISTLSEIDLYIINERQKIIRIFDAHREK